MRVAGGSGITPLMSMARTYHDLAQEIEGFAQGDIGQGRGRGWGSVGHGGVWSCQGDCGWKRPLNSGSAW